MGAGPTGYCWSCYAEVDPGRDRCPGCGGPTQPPAATDYIDRLLWALGHPLPDRRLFAVQTLGRRREPRAVGPLREIVDRDGDPYLVAAAVTALVDIVGRPAMWRTLEQLADSAPAPVRHTSRRLLAQPTGAPGVAAPTVDTDGDKEGDTKGDGAGRGVEAGGPR